jgi:glycosyltransferase involved in cell wall biosynthesis
MNILFIVPYVPNLIRVRPYNLLRALAAQKHQITLLTLWTDPGELNDIDHLKSFLTNIYAYQLGHWRSFSNCVRVLPTREPLQSAYCWQPELKENLFELTANHSYKKYFDIVHVEHLRGIRYALELKKSRATQNIPIVWDSVDSITRLFDQTRAQSSRPFSRLMANFEYDRTRHLEALAPVNFDRTLVTSHADMETYLELADHPYDINSTFSVLPNGVDLDYFLMDESISREAATLVVSGKMSYHANISMVNYLISEIMPLVWKEKPEVKLWIVGKDPPRRIQNLAKSSLIQVTGTVPDMRPYLQRATAAVVPLVYGTGVQNKVLESMACGTPVVSTSLAIAALGVLPGRDLLVADRPEEFARHILSLIESPELQRSLGMAGRQYVEENHRWGTIAKQLEGIYYEVITEKL